MLTPSPLYSTVPMLRFAFCYSGNELEIKATNCTQMSDYGDNCKAHPTPAIILQSLYGIMCSPPAFFFSWDKFLMMLGGI